MIAVLVTLALFGVAVYALLLSAGRSLPPRRLVGNDYMGIVARVALFLGVLSLPMSLGFSFSDVQGWLEDIWTSGGGVGTG